MFWPKEIWGRFADSLDDFRVCEGACFVILLKASC